MTKAQDLIRDFQSEVENTKRLLEAVPEDKLDWQPHEKSMTLAKLAGHIAETPGWIGTMLEDTWDVAEMANYEATNPKSSAELMEAFEQGIAAIEPALAGRDDAFMSGMWRMVKEGETLMELRRDDVIRNFLIHHVMHHRGQLTVYLRMLDQKVPATFGDSADYPMF